MKKFVGENKKITFIVLAIVLAIVAGIFSVAQIRKIGTANADAATRRAMNYEELTDDNTYYVDNEGTITDEVCEFVKFEAYYTKDLDGDGIAEKLLGSCNEIGQSDTVYIYTGVEREGSLKDAKITLNGNNIAYSMNALKDSILKENYVFSRAENKVILFNNMNAGLNKLLLTNAYASVSGQNKYTATNKITFTGTYVDSDNNEHQIKKEIEFVNDWYGDAHAELSNLTNRVLYKSWETQDNKYIEAAFRLRETKGKLIPQYADIEIQMAELEGEYPEAIICPNGTYDPETHILKIRNNTTNRDVTYRMYIKYSDEVFDKVSSDSSYSAYTMKMPIKAYYVCSNNSNEEFENPYITNEEVSYLYINFFVADQGENVNYIFRLAFSDAELVNKPGSNSSTFVMSKKPLLKAYDESSEEVGNMKYTTEWSVNKSKESLEKLTITMKDTKYEAQEKYGDQIAGYYLEDYEELKKVYFKNTNFIKANDYVEIYNEDTNELIKRFSYEELEQCNNEIDAYVLDSGVKHIYAKTNSINPEVGTRLRVFIEKEIDVQKIKAVFTRTQVENMHEMKATISGILGDDDPINGSEVCELETEKNYAKISLQKTDASVLQKLSEQIYIDVPSANTLYSSWKNGIFVVELPSQVINAKINSVTCANPSIKIDGYDLDKENGKKLIRIYTSNNYPTSGYRIVIDCDMDIDSRTATTTVPVNLYAYNEETIINYYSSPDIYDINGNGNRTESVFKDRASLGLYAEASFVTVESLTNFDNEGSVNIAPNITDVTGDVRSATVNIDIVNNFSYRVDNISILGRIPFEGNTFIGGNSLGSKFTTPMKNTGIRVPNELKNYAKVYYTSVENPTKDINDSANQWILAENVSSFDSVRNYLIILDNYSMNPGYGYKFSYDISIPENVNLNDDTYSCHIVYYDLNTEGGAVSYTVQPSKLGIRVVDYYDLELDKVKENTDLAIQGATYMITEILPENADPDVVPETKVAISKVDGKLIFEDLRVNQEYTIKEIRAPGNYELSDVERTFKLVKKANGDLEFVTDIDFDGEVTMITDSEGKAIVKSKVEDIPKIELVINKYDRDTNEPMVGVVFTVNGTRYVTNPQGIITVRGLSFGETNTIKESYAKGYYLDETEYEFVVNKDNQNNITIRTDNDNIANAEIENSEFTDLVNISIDIDNEKIPTYNLKVIKVNSQDESVKLENARFILNKIDDENKEIFETDEDGEITAQGLYQFVEGKDITGEYTIKETQSPNGYVNNQEEITFKVQKDENDKLYVSFKDEEYETLSDAEFVDDTLVLTISDKPLFSVKKVDQKTKDPLKNAGFVIFSLNSEGQTVDYAKDPNGEYIGEMNENGQYVVYTDENGYLAAPLSNGSYKIIEVKAPEGYALYGGAEIFTITEGNKWSYERVEIEKVTEIYTVEDLVDFANSVNNYERYDETTVKLMNSLDIASDDSYENPESDYGDINGDGINEGLKTELTKTNGKGFTPIGSEIAEFCGIFDGQGNSISNLYINSTEANVGLFGYIAHSTIKDLGIESGNILFNNADYSYVYIGGIAARAIGSNIINCYNKANISGNNSKSSARITAGGIVGTTEQIYISDCYNRGTIDVTNTASSGTFYAGGIRGNYSNGGINKGIINSYSTGDITCSGYQNSQTYLYPIANRYYTSSVDEIYNCYYLSSVNIFNKKDDTSVAKAEADMKIQEFVNLLGTDNWKMDENSVNDGYPILKLSTESEEVTEIEYIEDLVKLSNNVNTKGVDYSGIAIRLMNDLDFTNSDSYRNADDTTYGDLNNDGTIEGIKDELTNQNGSGFTPIGAKNSFKGIFNGQGHRIDNIYINSPICQSVGLFGTVNNAIIMNLHVSGKINVTRTFVGGVSNENTSIGGLAGTATNANIRNCSSDVEINVVRGLYSTISGGKNIGGIVGYATAGSINDCYSTGDIVIDTDVATIEGYTSSVFFAIGGIGGNVNGNVNNCYSRGKLESKLKDANINAPGYSILISGIANVNASVANSYTTREILFDESTAGNVWGGNISLGVQSNNCYYLDSIGNNANFNDGSISKDSQSMKTNEFVDLLGSGHWSVDTENLNDGYPILKMEGFQYVTEINCIEDLVELSSQVNDGIVYPYSLTIVLNKSLDFSDEDSYNDISDTSYGDINGDGTVSGIKEELTTGKGFLPIGWGQKFKANFDGNNNEIKNLYINRNDGNIGLFGKVDGIKISNLGVTGNVIGSSGTAGLCGYASGDITIENCNNYCNVTGYSSVGGIIGDVRANSSRETLKIINCNNYGTITSPSGNWYVSGIAGYASSYGLATIENCNNYGNVTGNYAGGVIGNNTCQSISIHNCTNSGKIEGTGDGDVGGIVAQLQNSFNMSDCSNSGEIISSSTYGAYLGGIIGRTNSYGRITNCNNSGNVSVTNSSSSSYLGGIVGISGGNGGTIEYCYNSGNIGNNSKNTRNCGGIVGDMYNTTITNCYNVGEILNAAYCGGIAGGFDNNKCTIKDSYNEGKITINPNFTYPSYSDINIGGIVGLGYDKKDEIINCYNLGDIVVSPNTDCMRNIGGISGNSATSVNCYNKGNITSNVSSGNSTTVYMGGISGLSSIADSCYNEGKINCTYGTNGLNAYIGGIIATGDAEKSYNTGNIEVVYHNTSATRTSYMYIGGVVASGNAEMCYNTGNIKNTVPHGVNTTGIYIGGIAGYNSSEPITNCYNTGNIDNNSITDGNNTTYVLIGGIAGSANTVINTYNTGVIHNEETAVVASTLTDYVGGIAGQGTVSYSYNTGDVINAVKSPYNAAGTGTLVGSNSYASPRYYLDTIKVIGPSNGTDYSSTSVSDEMLKSDQVYNTLHSSSDKWEKVEGAYPLLNLSVYTGSNESLVELTIEDKKLEFDITAEVGENIRGVRVGGTVSGNYTNIYPSVNYKKFVETVAYNENSTMPITITPDSGYQIVDIKINEENYSFTPDENGVVTIPAGYFENVTQNYNVVATFGLANEMLTINKVDENNNPVKDAVFEVREIETRETPTGVVGGLVQDGQQVTYVDTTTTHNDILGTLTNNGSYYFTTQSDGKLKANNLDANTTADSYMKIDLTDSTKNYRIRVNYSNEMSTSGRCSGLVAVTDNTTALTTSSSTGRFVYSTSTQTNVTSSYSQVLQAGNVYYLHFAQIVNTSYSLSSGQGFTINSINVYEDAVLPAYTFENVDGKYVSNNTEAKPVTTYATAYIPVDLRGYTGPYNIVVNSEISGQNHSGSIVVNQSVSRTTSSYGGVTKSNTMAASNNSWVVQGGKIYYVHLVHNNNSRNNTFTINSINVTLNNSELKYIYGITTDENGKANVNLTYGKYDVIETAAPQGYIRDSQTQTHVIGDGTNNNLTFVNESLKKVITHYYAKGTGPEFDNEPVVLSVDKTQFGGLGQMYTTDPIITINEYNLIANEQGEYIIPENATGTFDVDPIDVYYYYEREKAPYTVHYIYGGVEDYQEMIKDEAEIDTEITTYTAKDRDGFTFDEVVNLPLTVSENEDNNHIYVMYNRNSYEYRVKYFYENTNGEYIEDTTKEEILNAPFESIVSQYEDKVIDGYKFKRVAALDSTGEEKDLPLVIGTDTSKNIINVYYDRDDIEYTVHYFYDGVENTLMKSTKQAKFGSSITSQDIDDKNIEGYKLDRIKRLDDNGDEQDLPLVISSDADKNVINVYYVKDNFGYTIEYYYDNVKDDSKTVTDTAEFGSVINEYEDKVIDGYKLDKTENKPMTITSTAANNVMKVFYIKDTFEYEVHYFYDGVEDTSKAETGLSAVFGTEISNYTDKNIPGYKLEKTRALDENGQEGPLPLVIKSDVTKNRINIYYIKDDLGYEVHYFYDGVENTTLKESGNSTIGERISNYTDKCPDGYKLERAKALNDNGEEVDLPLIIKVDESKNIINVYYIKDNFGYTIEYYYDNVKDDSKTVTGTAEFGSVINEYEDKVIDGYKLDKTENKPMTITSTAANNVMKVFYVKDNYDYKIEYYYDNVKDDSKTVTGTAEFGSVIDSYEDKVIDGYKFDKTENKPMTITSTAANNVMKVFYVKDNYDYTIEYYYDNVKDDSKTVTGTAEFGSVIDSYEDKVIDGYKLDKTENKPMTITSTAANNVMKVFYVKDNYDYTIEYYYDNVKDNSKTVTDTAIVGTVIDEYEDKNIDGYKLDRVENKPMTITTTPENNVMKVFYVKDTFGYEVHYFYEGVEDESKAETGLSALFGSEITEYPDKVIEGYKLEKAKALNENGEEGDLPLVIKSDPSKNIINVYYIKKGLGYEVHYFYDGVEDPLKQENKNSTIGEQITEYEDKSSEEYRLDKAKALDENGEEVDLPLIIKADESKNIINVYYVHNQGRVIVEYVDNLTGEKIKEDTIVTGNIGEDYSIDRIDISGHRLDEDNLPDNETGKYKVTDQTVTYKYIKLRPYELLVRYTVENGDNDQAKVMVRYGTTQINDYTVNGILKVGDIELTELGTENYTVYETETPEYCKTVISEENPAVVELTRRLNMEERKYEFVENHEDIDGFDVVIDDVNKKVILDIKTVKNEKYDLALRKFISKIGDQAITDREPKVEVSDDNKITYVGNDSIEQAINNQNITYTIRMYNESDIKAKGKRVIEHIPDGLVFVPENETNKGYGWIMCKVDEEGKVSITENPEEAAIVITDYLVGKDITAFNAETKEVSYLDVQAVFKVDETKITREDRIVENTVQIMKNNNDDKTENDTSTEKVYVKYFDLSIEKYIEKVTVNTNGNETTEEAGYDKKGELVKVDVKRSEVNSTKLTVTYGLVVKNIGEIPGYATEITDYVPENFKLMEDGNWTLNGNTAVSTSLSNKMINPGESETLFITFEWNLSEGNIGERRNEAEITAYANDYDAEDITKDNKDGEDLLVSIKTGSEVVKVVEMIAMYTAVFALGVYFVKRKVVIRTK